MKIYLDLVFFINFVFDFLLLLTVNIILKRNISIFRILIGSIIGGISIFLLFIKLNSITLFLFKLIISILMPTTITKWNIVAPVYVPLLMRANISPQFTQTIFMMSDAAGKFFSPIYIYLIILIGFLYKQDQKVNTSIFDTMKLMMPVMLILIATCLIITIGWYVLGVSIGIGSSITL